MHASSRLYMNVRSNEQKNEGRVSFAISEPGIPPNRPHPLAVRSKAKSKLPETNAANASLPKVRKTAHPLYQPFTE